MARTYYYLALWISLTVGILLSCSKEKLVEGTDVYIEDIETLKEVRAEISAVGQDFIEISWSNATSSKFKKITYELYLNGELIMGSITTDKYSFINLTADTEYTVEIQARSESGLTSRQSLKANTLGYVNGGPSSIYKEFQIFDQSSLTGSTSLYQFKDGGHLVTRFLQHPSHFQFDTFKIIVFRIDQAGNILWYRLLSAYEYDIDVDHYNTSAIVNEVNKEAIIVSGNVMFKLKTDDGELVRIKQFKEEIPADMISSVNYKADGAILVGTNAGSLMEIDFNTFNINWKRDNSGRAGAIKSIRQDSKGNIFFIFATHSAKILVHKTDTKGNFLKEFEFDGSLPGESAPYGFNMNALIVDQNDHFYLFGRNYDFEYYRYFKFDAEGTLLLKNESSSNFLPKSAFFDIEGNLIVHGRIDGRSINTTAWIYKYDKSMNLLQTRTYDELEMHSIQAITQNSDGSYNIFLHYIQTWTYDNPNFVYIKTLANGNLQ